MRESLRASFYTASILTQIESRRGTGEEGKLRFHQAIFTLANICFCGYLEQFLRSDSGTHYLSLLVGMELFVPVFFTMAYFMTSAKEILEKSSAFPVSSRSKFLFILKTGIRRPLFLGFYFTTCFFFVVFFWSNRLTMSFAVLLYSLMMINSQLLISTFGVIARKISFAGAGVIFLISACMFIIGSILFSQDYLLGGFPLIQWVVNGITAAKSEEVTLALMYSGILVFTGLAELYIGLRVVHE